MPLPLRPTNDRDPKVHAMRIEDRAGKATEQLGDYIDRGLERLLGQMTFFALGVCIANDQDGKVATVTLDRPRTGWQGGSSATIRATWGRAAWSDGDLVGKRVRVGFNPLLSYWFLLNVAVNE